MTPAPFVPEAQEHNRNFTRVHALACKHTHVLYAHLFRQIHSFFSRSGFELEGYTLPVVRALVALFRTGCSGLYQRLLFFVSPLLLVSPFTT